MAVKTITIDMEAYKRLAERKAPGESFSEVIKELTAISKRTASSLLADAAALRFDEATLDLMEKTLMDREGEMPPDRSVEVPG